MADEAILNLSTSVTRPKVKIDGEFYELAVVEDFGPRKWYALQARIKSVQELQAKWDADEMTEDGADELEKNIEAIISEIMRELPTEVKERLSLDQKSEIMGAFFDTMNQTEKAKDGT